ncbi:peptidylprolyl isomerase [Bacteroidetes/Chlorobi group bacterium ChocPot_Mid]|nr:MAG: peptidylprolyl isomerase [Bacteroidetes/Chlorobi group bacterium ChocPot_Mid]
MKVQIISIIVFIALLHYACDTRSYKQIKQSANDNEKQLSQSPINDDVSKPLSANDTAIITHIATVKTSMGNFDIGLYGEDAPETVANFIGLSKLNYYNGVLFHRVAKNFLIQAGDRNTLFQNKKNEWGLGGESFYGGEIEDELYPNKPSYRQGYQKGVVAMANKGPNTNTSQFFICLEDAKKLQRKYTIFGKVINGMNVVENISNVPVESSNRGKNDGIPIKTIRIYSIETKFIKAPRIK